MLHQKHYFCNLRKWETQFFSHWRGFHNAIVMGSPDPDIMKHFLHVAQSLVITYENSTCGTFPFLCKKGDNLWQEVKSPKRNTAQQKSEQISLQSCLPTCCSYEVWQQTDQWDFLSSHFLTCLRKKEGRGEKRRKRQFNTVSMPFLLLAISLLLV